MIHLEEGEPLAFGADEQRALFLNGLEPEIRPLTEENQGDAIVHKTDLESKTYANLLAELEHPNYPVPVGVFRKVNRPVYEEALHTQVTEARASKGEGDLRALYETGDTWDVN